MTGSPDPVQPGSKITYKITLTNLGPGTGSDIAVRDTLPSTTTFVSCSTTAGSCQGSDVHRRVHLNQLNAGKSATITLVAKVKTTTPNGASIVNRASVNAAGSSDPQPGNNSSSVAVTTSGGGSASRPDIIVILTDDQPDHTLSLMPQVNVLIGSQGVRFSNFFVSTALCGPSRATLLTGQYSHNHTVTGNGDSATRLDDASTVATWLQDAGYRTALVGKYLNNYDEIAPYVARGWSEWRVFKKTAYYDFDLIVNGATVHYDDRAANYATSVIAAHAVNLIEETPPSQPLFLEFAPFSPHTPAQPADQDIGDFSGLAAYRPPSYNEANVNDKPLWVRQLPLLSSADGQKLTKQHEDMAESLLSVDRAVADIVDAMSRTGRLANAVIIFTGDNGWALGTHRWTWKSCSYEDCIKQPLLIWAPGIAPRNEAALASNIDLAPTIAEFAGVTPPPGFVNGRSLVPLLTNPGTSWRDALLIEYLGAVVESKQRFSGVRTSRYMYAEYQNGDKELYDLNVDPFELVNVIDDPDYNTVESNLRAQLQDLKAD